MDALLRLVLLALLVSGSFAFVSWWQRRPLRNRSGFLPGTTVFTAPGCRLCGPVADALDRLGVSPRLVDITAAPAPAGVRSLPTVVVADASGDVVVRRSGRAALEDVVAVAGVARQLAGRASHRAGP